MQSLREQVGVVELPADVDRLIDEVAAALVQPRCTPGPDVKALRKKLGAGVNTASGLVGNYKQTAPMPGDVALVGALVRRCVPRRDVDVSGEIEVPLDQSVSPPRGQVCVPGTLTVGGDLSVVAPLVVCGDLIVDGIITDCGPQSVIVVLGDLRCHALLTSGEVLVYGALTASKLVEGRDNDNVLEVHGTLATPALLSNDHAIEADALEVVHRPPRGGVWGDKIFDMSAGHLAALLAIVADPSLIDGDELDAFALASHDAPWKR